jgi:hypothetical protein
MNVRETSLRAGATLTMRVGFARGCGDIHEVALIRDRI